MKNLVIEKRYLESDWKNLKNLRNRAKRGKIPRYRFHQAIKDAKRRKMRGQK